jgi:hypothetical protein
MTKRLLAIALVLILGFSVAAVTAGGAGLRAQDAPQPTPLPGVVPFAVGDNEFDLDAEAPITLCVVGVSETIDDAYVTVQVFARTTDANRYEPLGVVSTRALGGRKLGECLPLQVGE